LRFQRVKPPIPISPPKRATVADSGEPAVKERIVAAARRHFLALGFRNITMDDLARELGVSKKTLYTYFESKTALLREVVMAKIAHIQEDMARVIDDPAATFPQKLQTLLTCQQNHFGELKPPFLRDVQRDAPEIFDLVEERRAQIIPEFFGRLFEEGRRIGMIRKDLPAELMIRVLLAGAQAILDPRKLADSELPPNELYAALLHMILEGVLTERGRLK
jgi:AcrR family transcriptional regulator